MSSLSSLSKIRNRVSFFPSLPWRETAPFLDSLLLLSSIGFDTNKIEKKQTSFNKKLKKIFSSKKCRCCRLYFQNSETSWSNNKYWNTFPNFDDHSLLNSHALALLNKILKPPWPYLYPSMSCVLPAKWPLHPFFRTHFPNPNYVMTPLAVRPKLWLLNNSSYKPIIASRGPSRISGR